MAHFEKLHFAAELTFKMKISMACEKNACKLT